MRRCGVSYATTFVATCPHGLLVVWQMHVLGDKPGCEAHYAHLIPLRRGY
jgi:hypothetical protein